MRSIPKILMVIITINFFTIAVKASEYFVSTEGNDYNPGTTEKPLRNIQNVAEIMVPGDICAILNV